MINKQIAAYADLQHSELATGKSALRVRGAKHVKNNK